MGRHLLAAAALVLATATPAAASMPEAQIGIGLMKPPYIIGPGQGGIELRDAFNAGLKKIRKNGTYAVIYRKYNEPLEP